MSKTGDLTGIRTIEFKYAKTSYRVAYKILEDETVVIVLLAGSHEGFYQKLKNLI